jgi:hypothetical protein
MLEKQYNLIDNGKWIIDNEKQKLQNKKRFKMKDGRGKEILQKKIRNVIIQ